MRQMQRNSTNGRFRAALVWLPALVAGAALRLWFIIQYPDLQGDPQIYGDIAANLVRHGAYGFSNADGSVAPTLIRLPGYPLFLAACFRIFGLLNFEAVMLLQLVIDLATSVLIAAFAGELAPPPMRDRVRTAALWLAVLCPFTAGYVAAPLTETLELFSIALALVGFTRLLQSPGWLWLSFTAAAWCYAALLRPDGALLGVVLAPALVFYGGRRMLPRVLVATLLSVLPFCLWAARNWEIFHVFQPLAPRYANDPGESTDPGFQHWTRTVCADLSCTSEIYWNANSDAIRLQDLPARAFDSPAQFAETEALLADYNQARTITPEIDARFAALAKARIRAHPLRYYLWLPLARLADMWLRPRVELLPIELRWWQYSRHPGETATAIFFGLLNLAYLALAAWACLRRHVPWLPVMLAFVLLRSLLLATIEAPEPRYTLECFPVLLALAAVALATSAPPVSPRAASGQTGQARLS